MRRQGFGHPQGIRMLKPLAGRDARRAAATGQEDALAEEALRILY